MNNKYFILYGWHLSFFSAKVRSYLFYKNIPFIERAVDAYTLGVTIKSKSGSRVMPVVVTPEEEWLQDTSVIIDRMEERFPDSSVHPPTPVQRFASYLMEAWGDEWWMPVVIHTRWSYPENYALFEQEAGYALLPIMPKFLQKYAVSVVANILRSYLPYCGIRPKQKPIVDEWTNNMLDLLDQHFAQSPFLFGNSPALGDFSLMGTFYAHLGRDPWPSRELVDPRKHLRAWINRMSILRPHEHVSFLANDKIAPTLEPVFRIIFAEFVPMLAEINKLTRAAIPKLKKGALLPRGFKDIEFPMGKHRFRRSAIPYTLWMAQRTLDVYKAMSADEQQQVRDWLTPLGGLDFLELDIPRLRRVSLHVAPA